MTTRSRLTPKKFGWYAFLPQIYLYKAHILIPTQALRYKSLLFTKETPKDLGSGHPNPSFSSANMRMEVPALLHDDVKIFDSSTILMYLEDAFPSAPTLLPASAAARASARMIEDVCYTHYEAINWSIGEITWFERATGTEAKRLLAAAEEQTRQIHAWLEEKLGSKGFFSGEGKKFGYADLVVAPVLKRSVIFGYGPAEGSVLQKWLDRVGEVPCVKETWAELVEGVSGMRGAGPSLWKPHGGRKREYRDHRLEWLIKNGGIGIVQQGLEDDNIRFSWPHPE